MLHPWLPLILDGVKALWSHSAAARNIIQVATLAAHASNPLTLWRRPRC